VEHTSLYDFIHDPESDLKGNIHYKATLISSQTCPANQMKCNMVNIGTENCSDYYELKNNQYAYQCEMNGTPGMRTCQMGTKCLTPSTPAPSSSP